MDVIVKVADKANIKIFFINTKTIDNISKEFLIPKRQNNHLLKQTRSQKYV